MAHTSSRAASNQSLSRLARDVSIVPGKMARIALFPGPLRFELLQRSSQHSLESRIFIGVRAAYKHASRFYMI